MSADTDHTPTTICPKCGYTPDPAVDRQAFATYPDLSGAISALHKLYCMGWKATEAQAVDLGEKTGPHTRTYNGEVVFLIRAVSPKRAAATTPAEKDITP